MNKKLSTITESPEVLQKQLRRETDAKKRQRLQALYLLASGQAESRVALAKLMAVHRHTIKAWLTRYEEDGWPPIAPPAWMSCPSSSVPGSNST